MRSRIAHAKAKKQRKRPFKPCKDGEVDGVCRGKEGQKYCQIMAWSC